MDTLATRYCRVVLLPSNRGRMVTWIRSPLKHCCVYVGYIATNSGKASVSIVTARYYKGKAIHNSELVSLRNQVVSECSESEEYSAQSEIIGGGSQCLEELQ
jgi:hypothetical protein